MVVDVWLELLSFRLDFRLTIDCAGLVLVVFSLRLQLPLAQVLAITVIILILAALLAPAALSESVIGDHLEDHLRALAIQCQLVAEVFSRAGQRLQAGMFPRFVEEFSFANTLCE